MRWCYLSKVLGTEREKDLQEERNTRQSERIVSPYTCVATYDIYAIDGKKRYSRRFLASADHVQHECNSELDSKELPRNFGPF